MNTKNIYRLDVSSFVQSVITPKQMGETKPKKYTEDDFWAYKRFAAKAASELRYGGDVVERILEAKTEAQVTRILAEARHNQT